MKYNNELFTKYCSENSVTLNKEYNHVNRDTKIEGKCITPECNISFIKTFRAIIENGAYCK